MGTYKFKSVGLTSQDIQTAKTAVSGSALPIGLKTPLRFGSNSEGIFAMHTNLGDQIKDNFTNLIKTNWGDRVIQYDFGANLRELTTEYANRDDFDREAVKRISSAVSKWMPYIALNDYSSTFDQEENRNTAIIKIVVTYDIPVLNITGAQAEITLYVIL